MKPIIFGISLAVLVFTNTRTVYAQQTSTVLQPLLERYYDIQQSLVSGNAEKAVEASGAFEKTLGSIDKSKLPDREKEVFQSLETKLSTAARTISGLKDITKQRAAFAGFSDQMILLARSSKLSDKDIYITYCPMKKTYWLSAEQKIQNPYYGNTMLTCGNIRETIHP